MNVTLAENRVRIRGRGRGRVVPSNPTVFFVDLR